MPRRLSSIEPSGSIKPFAGGTIPPGYLACDGSAVSQTTFSALFAALGTAFNTGGEGGGNFRLPDLRGRAPMGDGAGSGLTVRSRGQYIGTEIHQLTAAESGLPAHNHPYSDPGHVHDEKGTNRLDVAAGGGNHVQDVDNESFAQFNTGSSVTNITINNNVAANAGSAHNNMSPVCVIKFIIKT